MKIANGASIAALAAGILALTPGIALAQSSPAADAASNDGDIIVTAQRRSQRLVDVPISVATASSEDLERAGPTSIENLTKVTPGVYLQRAVYGLSPTVRGIGSTLPASGGEQNVAVYVDEIYYPTPTGNVFDLGSVAGVEVLKGPQGTLFGRNATGGAILIRTLDPSTEDLSGKIFFSQERFAQTRLNGYLNVPINDMIAVNASAAYRYSRGFVRDALTDDITNRGKSFTGRAKLLVQPTDNLSIVLVAAHSTFDDANGADGRNMAPAPLIAVTSALLGLPISRDRYVSTDDTDQYIRTKTDEYSARIKFDLGSGTLSSFTAFIRNRLDALSELDYSYINQDVFLTVKTKTFSQEVNYASAPDQPLTYVVGVYYFRNKSSVPILANSGTPLFTSAGKSTAIAAYADGTYKFGDFSVIAGVRYSREKRSNDSLIFRAGLPPVFRPQATTDKQWTPRLGLRYEIADRTNLYAMYSKGFKSGVFDSTSSTGPGVRPEKLDAFEVGYKTASRDFSLNAALFYYKYKDTQVNSTISGATGQIETQLFNVPKAESYGAEVDATVRVSDNLDLRAALAYTRARYIDFKRAPAYRVDETDPATNPNGLFFPGALYSNYSANVSGKAMVRAPKFTASGTITYHTPVGDGKELEFTLSPYYSSRVYFTFDNSLSQKAYATLDGAITLSLEDKVKFSIFGRNITNTTYKRNMAQNVLSLRNDVYADPATYGASISYSF